MRRVLSLVLAAMFSVTTGSAVIAAVGEDNAYTLGPGDRLSVTVFGHEDLSGQFEVDGSGAISLPLAGNVKVAGMSLRAAESAVRSVLKPDYLVNPQVSMQVMNYRPFFILGEVKNPGSYPYKSGLTVVEAVALAGGFTYRADEDDIEINRHGQSSEARNRVNGDTLVLPGDKINVTERFF